MSANNANLNKVKNMSSDESKPANNSEAPEKGGAKFNSANIKERDQSKLFVKVEGDEERARAAAKKEAAEKKDAAKKAAKEAAEEAAEARHEAKEQKLIAAAKADARKAAERATGRKLNIKKIIKIVPVLLILIIAAIVACVIIRRHVLDSRFATYRIEAENYADSQRGLLANEGNEITAKEVFASVIDSEKEQTKKIAYCVEMLRFGSMYNDFSNASYVDGECYDILETEFQEYEYAKEYLVYCEIDEGAPHCEENQEKYSNYVKKHNLEDIYHHQMEEE